MKTTIITLFFISFISISALAQIDRSKQPKPGPAPKIALEAPYEFQLKNGMTVLVVVNKKLPRVSYSLRIDNTPILEGKTAGSSSLLGAMLGNGTTSLTKNAFNEEVDYLGARMSFRSSGAYASCLSKYSNRILELFADAVINPLFTKEQFKTERDKLLESLKADEKSVDAVARRIGNALSYGTNHPYGEFITTESLNNNSLNDVRAFYQKSYNPKNAYLIVVGDIDIKTIEKEITTHFNNWKTSIELSSKISTPIANLKQTEIDFIDMPNAVQSNLSITNTVSLKMSDPDYHAVLIANKILGGGFNSYLNMNLREKHGYTYGARSSINANKYISRFKAGAAVRNMVTDSAIVESLKEINRIKTENVDAEALQNAKAKYVGDFVLALERPQTIANYAYNIKVNKLSKDFYVTFLEKINKVSVADVKRVANTYFKPENARIIVVGKGSEIIDNLIKTGIPIAYYDTHANRIEKPVFNKTIPNSITAKSVLNNYLDAIGGMQNAKTITATHVIATISGLAPMPLNAEIKTMYPNKESLEMAMQGIVVMKQKFNGKTGYSETQGQKKELTEKELEDKKNSYALFPEIYYNEAEIKLENITPIEGADCYKIKISKNNKETYRYYNVETGLLLRTKATTEVEGQQITTVIDYNDYKTVGNTKFPFSIQITTAGQKIPLKISEIKINEGVSDADFE